MRIALWAGHVGASGIKPSGQFGGGELHTFGFLESLSQNYDTTAIIENGTYPAFESAEDYGFNLEQVEWKPTGDSIDWLRSFDVLISMNHAVMLPPICRRNILVTFFPQYPEWDVSGYDTIIANSKYTASWVKKYWGREADVVYPPIKVQNIKAESDRHLPNKGKRIVCVGRFFDVPGGNNKRHLTILSAFKDLMRPDWELVFVGSIQNRKYYLTVRDAAQSDERIQFIHDINRDDYIRLLSESALIWSATGYEAQHPSSFEHFGVFAVEAMACGTIPMVFNGGGTPETEVITWETPKELIEKTQCLIEDVEKLTEEQKRVYAKSDDFDFEISKADLINVIEKPVAIRNKEGQSKIYLPDLTPADIKVGIWSDDPEKTLGFATVTRQLIKGLQARGFRVACIGIQGTTHGEPTLRVEDVMADINDSLFNENLKLDSKNLDKSLLKLSTDIYSKLRQKQLCPVWRSHIGDQAGYEIIKRFIEVEQPDILYLNYDIGNIRLMIDHLRGCKVDLPMICYVPIEGEPVIPQYIETLRIIKVLNGKPVLYTRWGKDAVKRYGGPTCDFVYHGADHACFKPLNKEHRKNIRFAVGWQDKFICMFVGRNKRTKGFGNLIEVARLLKAQGRDDIVFYFHTDPHDTMSNSSAPLDQIVHLYGLEDRVLFPMNFSQIDGIPYDEPVNIGPVPSTDDLKLVRSYNLASLSMLERYGAADAFVGLSELEGFGLTALEAMGCGLPVISIDDEGVQREVLGEAPMYVPIAHRDPSWHTGAKLAQANPEHVAEAIIALADDKKLQKELSKASLEQYKKYTWDNFCDFMAKAIMEQVI